MKRNVTLAVTAFVACWLLLPSSLPAQTYPSQGLRLIVPYAAGGVPDTVARFVASRLRDPDLAAHVAYR